MHGMHADTRSLPHSHTGTRGCRDTQRPLCACTRAHTHTRRLAGARTWPECGWRGPISALLRSWAGGTELHLSLAPGSGGPASCWPLATVVPSRREGGRQVRDMATARQGRTTWCPLLTPGPCKCPVRGDGYSPEEDSGVDVCGSITLPTATPCINHPRWGKCPESSWRAPGWVAQGPRAPSACVSASGPQSALTVCHRRPGTGGQDRRGSRVHPPWLWSDVSHFPDVWAPPRCPGQGGGLCPLRG